MTTINVEALQRDLPGALRRIEEGETLTITRGDEPIAELKPLSSPQAELRPYALAAGEFVVPPDFDEPLPDEVLDQFEL